MSAPATLSMFTVDCADPQALAEFYHRVIGWKIVHSQDEYAMISNGGTAIGFGQIPDYRPPSWPDPAGTKQFHFDLSADDLDKAEAACVEAGATKPDFQPGERWRVLLDPAGHPFCISAKQQD